MKIIILSLLLLFNISFAFAHSKDTIILIDAAMIKKANPGKIMLDGKVYADIDNDNIPDTINYSYTQSAPPTAGGNKNLNVTNNPILTFDIFLKGPSVSIQVNYMCSTIGIMKSMHKGMKDLYCGPASVLQWNGEDYILKNKNTY